MAENWASVAAEVAAAIGEVGFPASLEQPNETGPEYDPVIGAPTAHQITVIDDEIKRRDAAGMETHSVRVLTVSATGVVPVKGWWVAVRGERHRIATVKPLAPGGTDLLFDLELEA